MSQLWIVIPLVGAAALYVLWLLAPRSWRRRVGIRSGVSATAPDTDANCGCGKKQGGCH
jgi:hypothetical protein